MRKQLSLSAMLALIIAALAVTSLGVAAPNRQTTSPTPTPYSFTPTPTSVFPKPTSTPFNPTATGTAPTPTPFFPTATGTAPTPTPFSPSPTSTAFYPTMTGTVPTPTPIFQTATPTAFYPTVTSTATATAVFQTPTSTTASSLRMHVSDLDNVMHLEIKGRWYAGVAVFIVDEFGFPVANATVYGSWSQGYYGLVTCTTDSQGVCTLYSAPIKKNVASTTFTVVIVDHAALDYYPAANSDPDGDSDGTTIVIVNR